MYKWKPGRFFGTVDGPIFLRTGNFQPRPRLQVSSERLEQPKSDNFTLLALRSEVEKIKVDVPKLGRNVAWVFFMFFELGGKGRGDVEVVFFPFWGASEIPKIWVESFPK